MSDVSTTQSCTERLPRELRNRVDELRAVLNSTCQLDDTDPESGISSVFDYGLGFDYVPDGTFSGQREAFFRYQLSWGGPQHEFRFFVNPDLFVHRVEFWVLDWFDGANEVLTGNDEATLLEVWDEFVSVGAVEHQYAKSRTEEDI